MDSGYNTEEEWAPNPYQAEADAHLQKMFPHLTNDSFFGEQDVFSGSQSPGDDSIQERNIRTVPRRFRGPCTRNINHPPATSFDVSGLCSGSVGTSFTDSVYERDGSSCSVGGSDESWSASNPCAKSSTPDDNNYSFSFDGSTGVSAVRISSETWTPDHTFLKSRNVDCDFHLPTPSSNICGGKACDTTNGWRSERPTLKLSAEHDTDFYRSDLTFRGSHELMQSSVPRVHKQQDVTSFFDAPPGYPSQQQAYPKQKQPYDRFYANSCTDIHTWNEDIAHESYRSFDACREAQLRQQDAVSANQGGDGSANARSCDCDFDRGRLRKILLQCLIQHSDCIKDHIEGWNNDTKCTVTLGIMDNFARQGNVGLAGKCAELILHFGSTPMVVRTFNIMISACMKGGNVSAALHWWSCFASLGIEPTQVTYNSMINVCARGSDLGQAEWWMERMLTGGIEPCLKSFTILVVACGQSGSERRAEYWFQRMHSYGLRGDAILYNAMIDTYVKAGNVAKAEMWFLKMQADGVTPVQRTFNLLLHARAKNGNMHRAEQWHMLMQEAGLPCDEYTYGSLIEGCAKCHNMSLAEHFLSRMFSERLKPILVILRSLSKVYGLTDGDRFARVLALCMRDGGGSPQDVRKVLKSRGARFISRGLEELLADL
eukprot:TRINITY_DN7419_c0_g2_i2.p1 TRINITY_DN7419_c0_g2~~TRINITY_DN7419_c0_g2_i2.p1  ORF type:complete len:657 (+),score=52.85 TRINITY_DN7419_c0_g2_i2:123-2093(+)